MFKRVFGKRLSSFQLIILGFSALILAGAVLLMLPVSVKSGAEPTAEDALFTAVSAVCVTGLVVRDTASTWSGFGQAVILGLIQVGGLGVGAMAAFAAMVSGRKLSLLQRSMVQDSLSAHDLGGVVKMTGAILKTALATELLGALLMAPSFCSRYGVRGIWMAVFHSVSALCNAGFDVTGNLTGPYSSLSAFRGDAGVVLPICLLIVVGGIGFLTWDDIAVHKLRFRRYRMQSKVVLTAAAVLIFFPALFLFISEYAGYPLKERICLALFQAVTPRTAGFNTADLTELSDAGRALMIVLMLIGASPGSAAGGMKTTTAAVLLANAIAVCRRKNSVQLFGRRVEDSAVRAAATLMTMYLFLAAGGAWIISAAESLPIGTCLFETASALGTVGLSLGITPTLGRLSRWVLMAYMFFGRVGALTLMYAAVSGKAPDVSLRPMEKIVVG